MSKELWCHNYDCAVEEIAEEEDCDFDEAVKILDDRLDEDPHLLDDYGIDAACGIYDNC